MRSIYLIIAALIFFGAGCHTETKQSTNQTQARRTMQAPTKIAKVKIDQAGRIYLDGKPVAFEELKEELAKLKQETGAVWYYAEKSQGPNPQAIAVKRAIIDSQLPVRPFEKDFE